MLNSKQRAYLRSKAAGIDTIMQIGKGGITGNILATISDALEARELIKIRVLENSEYTPREAADIISEEIAADVVQVIGTKFVLFRVSSNAKKRKIDLSVI